MPSSDVTVLLHKWSRGDKAAVAELTPLVYAELRKMAHGYLLRERAGHTWLSCDLVHEAYLKLVDQRSADWQDRAHFFGVAAQIMRHILIDHARAQQSAKRGGGQITMAMLDADVPSERDYDLVALDDALKVLANLDLRQARIVELRFFAGLSLDDVAHVMDLSKRTVIRDWTTARAWLSRELLRK